MLPFDHADIKRDPSASLFTAWSSLQRLQTFLVRGEKISTADPPFVDTPEVLVDLSSDDERASLVSFQNASFGWDKDTTVLKEINLRLGPGLHMVVGSVASVRPPPVSSHAPTGLS